MLAYSCKTFNRPFKTILLLKPDSNCDLTHKFVLRSFTKTIGQPKTVKMAIDDHSSLAFELILQPSALNEKLLSRQTSLGEYDLLIKVEMDDKFFVSTLLLELC